MKFIFFALDFKHNFMIAYVKVGRCVTFATGRPCTWAYEMQTLFYHSAGGADERGIEIDPQKINQRTLSNAITIHPIKSPQNMEALGMRLKSKHRVRLLSASQTLRFKSSLRGNSSRYVLSDNLEDLPASEEHWSLIYNHYLYTTRAGGPRMKIPGYLYQGVLQAGLRIRIHFIRIRIKHFRLNTNPDPDPGL